MKADSPLHAIRLHCLDCSNGSSYEVEHCPCTDCSLFEYRSGHRVGFYERRAERKRARENSNIPDEEIIAEDMPTDDNREYSRFGQQKTEGDIDL